MGKIAKYDEKTNVIEILNIDSSNVDAMLNDKFEELKKKNKVSDDVIQPIIDKPESERTAEELMLLIVRKRIKDSIDEERKRLSEYSPFVEIKNDDEIPYGYLKAPKYRNEDGKVICTYEPYLDFYFIRKEIKRIRKELSDTDYIVIKCYEAQLLGEELPYTQEELKENVTKRAEMREQINQLQAILAKEGEVNNV